MASGLEAEVEADTQEGKEAMTVHALGEEEVAGLDPGVRRLVVWLASEGFETCDSGDGVTKPASGYEEAEREPHVYMIVTPTTMVGEAHRLLDLLQDNDVDAPDMLIEATYSPIDMTAALALHGVNDAALPPISEDGR